LPEIESRQSGALRAQVQCSEARRAGIRAPEYEQELRSSWRGATHHIATPYYGFEHVELCNDHGDAGFGDYDRWLAARHSAPDSLRGRNNAVPDTRYTAPQAWRTQVPEELYSTYYVAERGAAWLREHARTGSGRPFLVQISFPDPHHPFTPPGRYWDMYRPADVVAPPTCRPPGETTPPHVRGLHEERAAGRATVGTARAFAVNEREAREIIALTYGMISMIDDRVGSLMAALHETGLAANTVVIFTSDHGDFMGDHGLMLKGPIHYQGIVRVPFIWAEPSGGAGRRCRALAGTLDIARTVLARAGVESYNGIQGRNLADAIAGRDEDGAEVFLVEEDSQHAIPGIAHPARVRTLITRRWRLSLYRGAAWGELYDLADDPDEERNLWNDVAYSSVRAQVTELMGRTMMELSDCSPLPTRRA
jgi:arylsulfatase A-like enzyme